MKPGPFTTWLIIAALACVVAWASYMIVTHDSIAEIMCQPGMCFITGVPE